MNFLKRKKVDAPAKVDGQRYGSIRYHQITESDSYRVAEAFHSEAYVFVPAVEMGDPVVLIDTSEGLRVSRPGNYLVEDKEGRVLLRKPSEFIKMLENEKA